MRASSSACFKRLTESNTGMANSQKTRETDTTQAAKLKAILESAVDAIVTIDGKGLIQTANPAAERLFQFPEAELIGQNIKLLMPEPYKSEHDGYIDRFRETGERRIIGVGREVTGLRKDRSTFPMHLSVGEFHDGEDQHFVGIIHDLSERKGAERALRQAQKMEAVGQLTGGVAHDFNNLLTVITGNLELLDMKLDDDTQRDLLKEALEAADLGARLTDRLLAFARRSPLEPEVVDLNRLALGLTDMLHRTLGEAIDLSTALSTDLWQTMADPTQIETAIVNLAVNARDAMPNGGKLIIETRNAKIDEEYVANETGLVPGDYVQLSVSDTGTGMPPEVRDRVFEPFFTTKKAGRGTGLGLSMVYGFARQSGGHVTIYSEVDTGTTANLYLSRHDAQAQPKLPENEISCEPAPTGELILVVEDDDRVRRLTLTRLKELGYEVLEAANGVDALGILDSHGPIDLVFTDLVMPGGMSGYDLCEQIRKTGYKSKLLLTSGYAEELAHEDKLTSERLRILRKPYRQAELARSIRRALDDQ